MHNIPLQLLLLLLLLLLQLLPLLEYLLQEVNTDACYSHTTT